jgi:hypothetical protein
MIWWWCDRKAHRREVQRVALIELMQWARELSGPGYSAGPTDDVPTVATRIMATGAVKVRVLKVRRWRGR